MHTRSRINKEQPISQSFSWRTKRLPCLRTELHATTPIVRSAGDRTWRLASFVSFGNCHHITSVLSHHAAQRWCPARHMACWSAVQWMPYNDFALMVRLFLFDIYFRFLCRRKSYECTSIVRHGTSINGASIHLCRLEWTSSLAWFPLCVRWFNAHTMAYNVIKQRRLCEWTILPQRLLQLFIGFVNLFTCRSVVAACFRCLFRRHIPALWYEDPAREQINSNQTCE